MMEIKHKQPIFSAVLEIHLSRFPGVPSFFIENSTLVDFIVNEEIEASTADAVDALDEHISLDVKHVMGDWYCIYEPCQELWMFNRLLTPIESDHKDYAERMILRENLKQHLFDISPREFESFLFELFSTMPDYDDPIARPMSRDGGYEMCVCFKDPVTNTRDRILIQAKHERRPVSVSHTRELIGTLDVESGKNGRHKRIRGLMVSLLPPSPYSEAAAEATHHSIDFLTAEDLVDLMIRYNIGCTTEKAVRNSVDKTFWTELREV